MTNPKKHLLYQTWYLIRLRCTDPLSPSYESYGARGIEMSDEWFNSFELFVQELGDRPTPEHSVDRIDNTKGYIKGNCRWATAREQGLNRKNNRFITAFGKTQTISEWAREFKIRPSTISSRIKTGWGIENALTAPTNSKKLNKPTKNLFNPIEPIYRRNKRPLTAFGKTQSISRWAKETGICRHTINNRLNEGWDIEKILITPTNSPKPQYLYIDGKLVSEKDYAEYHGIKLVTFRKRLEAGMTPEDAASKPLTKMSIHSKRKDNRYITAFGQIKTLAHWARDVGIKRETIAARIKKGWTVEDALSIKVEKSKSKI